MLRLEDSSQSSQRHIDPGNEKMRWTSQSTGAICLGRLIRDWRE